jgi:hypothetical protein
MEGFYLRRLIGIFYADASSVLTNPVPLWFMVDNVIIEQASFRVLQSLQPVIIIFPLLHTYRSALP